MEGGGGEISLPVCISTVDSTYYGLRFEFLFRDRLPPALPRPDSERESCVLHGGAAITFLKAGRNKDGLSLTLRSPRCCRRRHQGSIRNGRSPFSSSKTISLSYRFFLNRVIPTKSLRCSCWKGACKGNAVRFDVLGEGVVGRAFFWSC